MAENKTNAMRLLEKGKIPYTVHTYEAAQAVDGVTVAGKIGRPPEQVFKTLVTKGKNGCYVFVIPAAAELDLKKAARAVGEKAVEMLPVKELLKTTGYIRGGCSPLGMKKAYPTVIDSHAREWETIVVSAGRIGWQMELSPERLREASGASFGDLLLLAKGVGGPRLFCRGPAGGGRLRRGKTMGIILFPHAYLSIEAKMKKGKDG